MYPILLYHQVESTSVANASDDGGYGVSPDEFEAQMRFLAERGYHCVSCRELERTSFVGDQAQTARRIALTFDDGYRSFAENAYPVLLRYGFTATVFVVTGLLGATSDWERSPKRPLLAPGEIRELAVDGIEFGSHTHTHRNLTVLTSEEALYELRRSREVLGHIVGGEVTRVAYPFGAADERIRALAAEAGYTVGFSVSPSGPILKRVKRGMGLLPFDPFDIQRREVRAGYGEWRFRVLLSPLHVVLASVRKARASLKRR